MANNIDLIYAKSVEEQLARITPQLQEHHKLIVEMAKNNIKFSEAPKLAQTPNELKKVVDETAKIAKENERRILSERKLQTAIEKKFDAFEKGLQKEAAALAKAEGAFQRYQNSTNVLIASYKDLAIRKELGNTLSAKEEQRLQSLTERIKVYQNALKKVDADIGNHQRNVGNYASGFNSLGNSINQLTREAPAFANSIQTGFMALSNNIPILFDAMQQIINQNKELQAQGKATVSPLKQLVGAFFSLGTALSVGVTLLTIYGADLYDLAFGATEAEKAQNRFKETLVEINSVVPESNVRMKSLSDTVLNYNLSEKQRSAALKELTEIIPELNGVTLTQANLTELVTMWTEKYSAAAVRKAQVDMLVSEIAKLENENLKAKSATLQSQLKWYEKIVSYTTFGAYATLMAKDRIKEEVSAREDNIDALTKQLNALMAKTALDEQELKGLDKNKTKTKEAKKEKEKLTFAEIESEYLLRKAILERRKAEEDILLNDSNLSIEGQIDARYRLSEITLELIDLEKKHAQEAAEFTAADNIEKNNLALKNKEINLQEWVKNAADIQKTLSNTVKRIEVEASQKQSGLRAADLEFFRKIEQDKRKTIAETQKLILDGERAKLNRIVSNERLTLKARQDAFNEQMALAKKQLMLDEIREKSQAGGDPAKLAQITEKYKNLRSELDAIESPFMKANQSLKDFLSTVGNNQVTKALQQFGLNSLSSFLTFDENGQSPFDKLLESAEPGLQKAAVYFQAFGDVGQEVFSKLLFTSNDYFEALNKQNEEQYNTALKFAGDNAAARENIEMQYERRRKEIQKKQAKAKQQEAIFNIAVDTAQAVMATFARLGYVAGVVPAAIVAGIGLAQILAVSSRQIPEYALGLEMGAHKGGILQMNEREQERLILPSGRVISPFGENQIVNAPQGTYVATQSQWNDIARGANYRENSTYNGLDADTYFEGIDRLSRKVGLNLQLTNDERGLSIGTKKRIERANAMENRAFQQKEFRKR